MRTLSVRHAAAFAVVAALTQTIAAPPQTRVQQPILNVQATSGQTCAAISRDGRLVATAGLQIILWDAQTGRQIRQIPGQADALAFSPDARYVAASESVPDSVIRLWETSTGRQVWEFKGSVSYSSSIAFTPDGHYVASGSNEHIARLIDVRTGTEARRFTHDSYTVATVAVSPDGRYLLTGASDFTGRLWEIATGREIGRIPNQQGRVRAVAFSPDGHLFMTSAYDNKVHVWETQSLKEAGVLDAREEVWSLAFSPDGKRAVTGGAHTVAVWDLASGSLLRALDRPDGESQSVAFLPDGRRVLASGKNIGMWDAATGAQLNKLQGQSSRIGDLVFSRDGRYLIVAGADGMMHLWDMAAGREIGKMEHFNQPVIALALSRDGRTLAAIDEGGNIASWTFPEEHLQVKLASGLERPISLELSADGRHLVATGDTEIRLWDWPVGREIAKFQSRGAADCAILSPDGTRLLTWGLDSRAPEFPVLGLQRSGLQTLDRMPSFDVKIDPYAHVFDTAGGREVLKVGPNGGVVHSLAFSPDGRYFVTGAFQTPYRLWETSTGRELQRYFGLSGDGGAAAFSPDGRLLAAASRGNLDEAGGVALWDVQSGKPVRSWNTSSDSVVFSPDGRLLVVRNQYNEPQILDVATGKVVQSFASYLGLRDTVRFSPDSRLIAAGHGDLSVHLLELVSGKELGSLFSFEHGAWAVVDPEHRFDTTDVEALGTMSWTMPDDPMRAMGPEMFLRDYFEPRLLPRLLAHEQFKPVRALADLNRAQPRVSIVSIAPEPGRPDEVSVTIGVAAGEYRFQRDNKPVVHRSGANDLRLFRDGHLVAQLPNGPDALLSEPAPGDLSTASLKAWQAAHAVPLKDQTLHNIRLAHSATGRSVEFSAYAFNADRVKGETARHVYTSQTLPASTPRAYIITMGVSAYQDNNWDLWFAAEGAKQMRDFAGRALNLQNRYRIVPITLLAEYEKDGSNLKEKTATKSGLKQVIDSLAGRRHDPGGAIDPATPDDLVFLYISSHGYAAPDGRFFVIPFDVGEPAGVTEKVLNRALTRELPQAQMPAATAFLDHSVSSEELAAWLRDVDAGEVILILDSCHSAEVTGRDFKPGPMGDRGFGQLAYDKRMRVLVATQADNIAIGPKTLNQSLLTYALLHPSAPGFDVRDWLAQAEEQVPELYRKYYPEGKAQQPVLFDFSRSAGEVK